MLKESYLFAIFAPYNLALLCGFAKRVGAAYHDNGQISFSLSIF